MQESVKQDRERFLGGSDIPIILGISPFKTRFQLLREKAELAVDEFEGNIYTNYGNTMESKIREYVSKQTKRNFEEGKHITDGDPIGIRCHTDGEDATTILEIKTTSDMQGNIRAYEAQLCFYMMQTNKNNGILACYIRPEDLSEELDPDNLYISIYTLDEFKDWGLVDKINIAVEQFINDLQRLKNNPELREEDFIPAELIAVADQVIIFEQKLAELEEQKKQIEEQKNKLFEKMAETDVKSWETINGYLITRVDPILPSSKEEVVFDEEAFKLCEPDLYSQYQKTITKKSNGRKGYVLITSPEKRKKGKKK